MRKTSQIPCRFYRGPGTCKKGQDCEYLHGKPQNTLNRKMPAAPRNNPERMISNPNMNSDFVSKQPNNSNNNEKKTHIDFTQPTSKDQRPGNALCNFFIQGTCNRGDKCPDKHQFSLDANVERKLLADFTKIFKENKLGLLAIDVYTFERNNERKMFAIMLTNAQLNLLRLPDGESWDFPLPNGKLTTMHYDRTDKILFLGFLDPNTQKGGLAVYKDFGNKAPFELVFTSNGLHQKDIMSIQIQDYKDNKLIITTGQDDHVRAWIIKSGKLEQFASGVTTAPIYSTICNNESVFAGCSNGKIEILKLQDAANGYNRVKEFEVAEPNSIITKIIKVEETIYATSFCDNNNQVTGHVGIFADVGSGKILHLADYSMHTGVTTIQYVPTADMLFVGYSDGTLEFRQKEGFKLKGRDFIHQNPIKDIKQIEDLFLVVDQQGLFTVWGAVEKSTASTLYDAQQIFTGNFDSSLTGMNVESNNPNMM